MPLTCLHINPHSGGGGRESSGIAGARNTIFVLCLCVPVPESEKRRHRVVRNINRDHGRAVA